MRSATKLATVLVDRRSETSRLDLLLAAARTGASGALVVRGEAGIGKTALIAHFLTHAAGCQVVRSAGVESEMELPFAAVQQLCRPLMKGLVGLPVPQREALSRAFGLHPGPAPDRFLIALAVQVSLALG